MSDPSPAGTPSDEVLCVGELLWDELPTGRLPGGAPFNVAAHLAALGIRATLLSRVGRDPLAAPLVEAVRASGVRTDLIQHDDALATGTVAVTTARDGQPTYLIRAPAAWDRIEVGDVEQRAARGAAAIVFGSLAQRDPFSRAAIGALRETPTLRVFDVNLRPPHLDLQVIGESLGAAEVVKVNVAELRWLAERLGLPGGNREGAEEMARRFGCEVVCVTAGERGAGMLREGRWSSHPGFRVEVADTIGAGDAFLAALVRGLLRGDADGELLREASRLGAWVASRRGANPPPPDPAWQPEPTSA